MRGGVFLALLLAGCGAARPVWPEAAAEASYTVPLVMAWHPARLLVEVAINGIGPMLFAVDTGAAASRIRPDVAERLRLRRVGDPTRGRRVAADRLALGELELRAVPFEVDEALLGELYGRPVVGVLGVDAFAGHRLEHDRGAGVLRFPPPGAPLPAGAGTVTIAPHGVPVLPVTIAGERLRLRFASGRTASALTAAAARRVGEAEGEPAVLIDGVAAAPGPWQIVERAAEDGHLGLSGLAGLGWRLDAARGRFSVWSAPPAPARFTRFGPLPCEPSACIDATVAAVEPGRITVAFAAADERLPERFWLRVDLGTVERPLGALVQLRRRPEGLDGPLTATLDDDDIRPGRVRAVGAPVDVLDVVPVDRPCPGVVCLHRQEGDATDSFVESSAAAVGTPADGPARLPPGARARAVEPRRATVTR